MNVINIDANFFHEYEMDKETCADFETVSAKKN